MAKKSNKSRLFILIVTISAIFLYLFLRLISEDETARLRRVIYAAEVALEKKDTSEFINFISEDYSDNYGNTRLVASKLIDDTLREHKNISLTIKKLQLEVSDDEAKGNIAVTYYFTKNESQDIFYEKLFLKVDFKKAQGHWKVYYVEFLNTDELLSLQGAA